MTNPVDIATYVPFNVSDLRTLLGDLSTAPNGGVNRGGFYLAYFNYLMDQTTKTSDMAQQALLIASARQVLLQAEITTYSGFAGGAALIGNALAKNANPSLYPATLDEFSYDIANGLLTQMEKDGSGIENFTADKIQLLDRGVWIGFGMGDYFPGNAQFANKDVNVFLSAGTLASALAGLQLAFGGAVGYTQADAIAQGGILDTSNPYYDVVLGAGGRVLFVQDKLSPTIAESLSSGAITSVAALDGSVDNVVSNWLGVYGPTAVGLATDLGTLAGVLPTGNQAISAFTGTVAYYLSNSLLGGVSKDAGVQDEFAKFVGAHDVPVNTQASLPQHIIWDNFNIVLRTDGTFISDRTSHILIGYQTAEITGSDQGDVLIGFGNSTLDGGSGNNLLLGKDNAMLNGGAGNDVLVGSDHAQVNGGDGNDKILIFGNAIGDGGAGNDILLAYGVGSTTIGGLGRDLIFNASQGGIIWGDVANSILDTSSDQRYYLKDGTRVNIADDASNADNFVWSRDTTIMDPQKSDIITFYGVPLTGRTDNGGVVLSLAGLGLVGTAIATAQIFKSPLDTVYVDQFLPFIDYKFVKQPDGSYDLLIGNTLADFVDATEAALGFNTGLSATLKKHLGFMTVKDFIPVKDDGRPVGSYGGLDQAALKGLGKLGLVFEKSNPIYAILALLPQTFVTLAASGGGPLVDAVLTAAAAVDRFTTALNWYVKSDPLVLDLSGQGLITTRLDQPGVHFDLNNSFFASRSGWLSGNEGFLVLDKNHNGVIDDASEMFGSVTGSGFGDLAAYDSNHDGVINATDAIFSQLRVWIDANGDGVTDPGELHTLSGLGITSISLSALDLGHSATSGGTALTAAATFTYANGTAGTIYDATFPTDPTNTIYRGESGAPAWAGDSAIDAKGFGHITTLGIAAANDFDLASLLATTAAAMTVPDLTTLVQQAGPVLGLWGETLNLTRELDPVLLGKDGHGNTVLLDRAICVEDATGG